jgi:outer membrane receptor protein involved in Fe transport
VSKTSDGIDINSAFVLNQSRIAPADYAAFRTFLRETDAALVERVVVDLGRVK